MGLHVARKLESRQRFAVRATGAAAVSPGRSTGPVSPRSWADGDVHAVPHLNPFTYTKARCCGKWLLSTAYASRLVI